MPKHMEHCYLNEHLKLPGFLQTPTDFIEIEHILSGSPAPLPNSQKSSEDIEIWDLYSKLTLCNHSVTSEPSRGAGSNVLQ